MRPEFDPNEEFLVAYYRQLKKSGGSTGAIQTVATVVIGASFFLLGYFKDDATWSVIGFILVAFQALKDLFSAARYNRVLAGVIEKYEDAVKVGATDDDASTSDGDSPGR